MCFLPDFCPQVCCTSSPSTLHPGLDGLTPPLTRVKSRVPHLYLSFFTFLHSTTASSIAARTHKRGQITPLIFACQNLVLFPSENKLAEAISLQRKMTQILLINFQIKRHEPETLSFRSILKMYFNFVWNLYEQQLELFERKHKSFILSCI